MIRNIKLTGFFFSTAFAMLILCSCGFFEARDNKEKLANIRIGMTKSEVKKVMGGEPPKGLFQQENVFFYYTDPKWYDGCVTRDECTPFVFSQDEDRLIGFGYDYYREHNTLPSPPPAVPEKTDADIMRDFLIKNSKK